MDLFQSIKTRWQRQQLSPEKAQQQRIDQRLRAIEQQGSGSVLVAHGLAYLLVIAFSAGSLIALAGDAVNHFLQQARAGVVDIPSLISFVVSFTLVFAMDTAMVIAAATVRMHRQRNQPGLGIHVAMIIGVCVVESSTYLYMSYIYDHPAGWVAWTILGARALAAPIVAVYLSLARTLPISARDIITQVEIITGRGVLMDMTKIADDPASTTERKTALYQASATMIEVDAQRFNRLMAAERETRGELTAPAPAPTPQPLPLPTPQTPPTAARALSNHDLRRAALARQMDTSLEEYDLPIEDEEDWARYAPPADDRAWDETPPTRIGGHPTSPRNRSASFSNHASSRNGSSAARIAPRASEMAIDLPTGKTARKDDVDQGKRVMNYLDKHPFATIPEIVQKTGVSKPTVRRHRDRWIERNRRLGEEVPAFTTELPVVLPEREETPIEHALEG